MTGSDAPVLAVKGLGRIFQRGRRRHAALNGISFEVFHRQTLAVVGESGAGKSTLVRLIAGLDRPTSGSVLVDGAPLKLRKGSPSPVQMIFQNPTDALNPFLAVGKSVAEPILAMPRRARAATVAESLVRVGLDPARAGQRPAAFSGGQLQRLVIARALLADPKILLCDEPTSALDVSVQAQIINLLLELQASIGFACVLVTHDLSIARVLADDVIVLRDGEMVEQSSAGRFFAEPSHAYSRSLLHAVSGNGEAGLAQPRG